MQRQKPPAQEAATWSLSRRSLGIRFVAILKYTTCITERKTELQEYQGIGLVMPAPYYPQHITAEKEPKPPQPAPRIE